MKRFLTALILFLLSFFYAYADVVYYGNVKVVGTTEEIAIVKNALAAIEYNDSYLKSRWKRLMFGGNVKRVFIYNRSDFRKYYGSSRDYSQTWGFFSSSYPNTVFVQSDHVSTSSSPDIENTLLHEAVHMAAYLYPSKYSFRYGAESSVKYYTDQYVSYYAYINPGYRYSSGSSSGTSTSSGSTTTTTSSWFPNATGFYDWGSVTFNTLYQYDLECIQVVLIWQLGNTSINYGIGTSMVRMFYYPGYQERSTSSYGSSSSSSSSGGAMYGILPIKLYLPLYIKPSQTVRSDFYLCSEFTWMDWFVPDLSPGYFLIELKYKFNLLQANTWSLPITLSAGYFTSGGAYHVDSYETQYYKPMSGWYLSVNLGLGQYR